MWDKGAEESYENEDKIEGRSFTIIIFAAR